MDVSIIIVNFNSAGFVKACLSSLQEIAGSVTYEVVVVDNASLVGDADSIESSFPWATVLRNHKNCGFSAANNQGVSVATGRHFLFLNPDTVLEANTLPAMIAFMDEHPDAGAATCFVRLPTGELDDAAHRGFPTPWNSLAHFSGLSRIIPRSKLFSGYSLGSLDLTTEHEIDALAGCFMLVRREAGEQVGWWDEDYFFYGEDIDFCYRLKKGGWKIYFVPDVSILHYKGMSSGIKRVSEKASKAERSTRIEATRARFDAMRIFYQKHYRDKYPAVLRWLVFAAIAVKERVAISRYS